MVSDSALILVTSLILTIGFLVKSSHRWVKLIGAGVVILIGLTSAIIENSEIYYVFFTICIIIGMKIVLEELWIGYGDND